VKVVLIIYSNTPTTAHHCPSLTASTHHAMLTKNKKGVETLANEICLEPRQTNTLKVPEMLERERQKCYYVSSIIYRSVL